MRWDYLPLDINSVFPGLGELIIIIIIIIIIYLFNVEYKQIAKETFT